VPSFSVKKRRPFRLTKTIQRAELSHYSAAHIIYTYQQRFRGLAEYYKYTVDRARLSKLKHTMEVSLTKTLAHKFKTRVKQIYGRFKGHKTIANYTYNTLQVEVPSQNGTISSTGGLYH